MDFESNVISYLLINKRSQWIIKTLIKYKRNLIAMIVNENWNIAHYITNQNYGEQNLIKILNTIFKKLNENNFIPFWTEMT